MEFVLAGGAAAYSAHEALDTVREYAFSTVTIRPARRFKSAFAPEAVPQYAYRTFDCVAASDGPGFTDLDLLISAGLNARIDVRTFARLRTFVARAAADLDRAHRMQPYFLQLSRGEVGDTPPQGSAGWHLFEAWRQLMATPGLKVARVHKVLHHKRPHLFPVLDNKTIKPIKAAAVANGCGQWQLIYDEIHAHHGQFDDLARGFDAMRTGPQDVSLSLLRLYDILAWMKVAG